MARARRGGGGEIPDDGSPSLADPARGVDERQRLRGEADGFAAGRGEAHAPRVRVDAVEGIVGRARAGDRSPAGARRSPGEVPEGASAARGVEVSADRTPGTPSAVDAERASTAFFTARAMMT